jgi:hypothetical protein
MKKINNSARDLYCVLIDLEFTGLDKTVVTDNEIVQVKILNTENGKSVLRNFNSKKPLSAYTQLAHRVHRYEDCPLFNSGQLDEMLLEVEASTNDNFWGFGVDQDVKMLSKYGCRLKIRDIRTHFQMSEFSYRMATEGSGLEATYLIVMGECPPTASHADFSEMLLIEGLFQKMKEYPAGNYMKVVPFGHCAGMSLSDYVSEYRRQADGYRYNNSDSFSDSLSYHIEAMEYRFDDDDNY